MTTHAKLSPSASKRWMSCPGSVQLIEKLKPVEKSNPNADEGTVAHAVAEKCLKGNWYASQMIGKKILVGNTHHTVTKTMAEHVQTYLDYVKEKATGQNLMIEHRCTLKSLKVPGLDGGTSDAVIKSTFGVEVIDLKYGQGVVVEVEDNPQLMQYALGVILSDAALCKKNVPVTMTIVQPRAYHEDGPIRSIVMSSTDLINWAKEELVPAAKATREKDAPLAAGDSQCKFCPVAGQCPALYKKTQEIAVSDFNTLPAVESLTQEQVLRVLDHADMIRSFIVAVEQHAKTLMDQGAKIPGYKLVEKTKHRKFVEDIEDDFSPLWDYMEECDAYDKKLKTLTEIEKYLKKNYGAEKAKEVMDKVTTKPEGETVIARQTDKRKEVQPSIVTDFDGLD